MELARTSDSAMSKGVADEPGMIWRSKDDVARGAGCGVYLSTQEEVASQILKNTGSSTGLSVRSEVEVRSI